MFKVVKRFVVDITLIYPPHVSYIYNCICNCRQYCFGLLGLISAVLMSRMGVKLKSHPKCPTHVVHLSHARVLKLAS